MYNVSEVAGMEINPMLLVMGEMVDDGLFSILKRATLSVCHLSFALQL